MMATHIAAVTWSISLDYAIEDTCIELGLDMEKVNQPIYNDSNCLSKSFNVVFSSLILMIVIIPNCLF